MLFPSLLLQRLFTLLCLCSSSNEVLFMYQQYGSEKEECRFNERLFTLPLIYCICFHENYILDMARKKSSKPRSSKRQEVKECMCVLI